MDKISLQGWALCAIVAALYLVIYMTFISPSQCEPTITALPAEGGALAYRLQTCGDGVILLNQDTVLQLQPLAEGSLE